MSKTEFIRALADKTGMSAKDAAAAVNASLDIIQEALQQGESVAFTGFGTFEVKSRAARTGRNPKTKEVIEIPASRATVFKAGKPLKEAVNG